MQSVEQAYVGFRGPASLDILNGMPWLVRMGIHLTSNNMLRYQHELGEIKCEGTLDNNKNLINITIDIIAFI